MNEARLSHLPFWGPSEFCFFLPRTSTQHTHKKNRPVFLFFVLFFLYILSLLNTHTPRKHMFYILMFL